MYHSITFGTKNTWTDWHLIPSSRPVFNPPVFREKFIDIPGVSGLLDLSTIFSGEPVYGSRTGSLEFIITNDYWTREVTCATIMAYLHGQHVQAILEDDPDYYYEGFFFISEWSSGKSNSIIKIDYNVSPYKRDKIGTIDLWEWDVFDFETGIIQDNQEYTSVVVNDTTITLEGRGKQMYLGITSNAIMNVVVNGVTKTLAVGLNIIPGLTLIEGTNTLRFMGSGIITIDYRGGSL